MSAKPDHINIRRQSSTDPSSDVDPSTPTPSVRQRPTKADKERERRYKIGAALAALASLLLLIALLSYTDHDSDNARLSLRDMSGVIRGDEEVRVRFDTTHNWLGLLGAVLSHWFYHSTIGRWALLFPVLAMIMARDVFRYQRIQPLTSRRAIATVATGVIVAALVGTMQMVPALPSIDVTWSGAIGQFLASVVSQFIGTIGSSIVFLALLATVVVVGFEVNVASASVRVRLAMARVRDMVDRQRSTRASDDGADIPEPSTPADDDAPEPIDDLPRLRRTTTHRDADEPAEMLRTTARPSPAAVQTQPLASGVRIVRAVPKTQAPPAADDHDDRQPAMTVADHGTPPASAPQQLDLDMVQRRLAALHPTKTIEVHDSPAPVLQPPMVVPPPPTTPMLQVDDQDEEPWIDEAEIVEDEEWDVDEAQTAEIPADLLPVTTPEPRPVVQRLPPEPPVEPALPPVTAAQPEPVARPERSSIAINRPLTVTVEAGPAPEPEMPLTSTLLYDEQIVYRPPSGDLLIDGKDDDPGIDDDELQNNARTLQDKLETFRIRIENLTVQPGPVVTQYEFVPAAGIKVSQIESLADDIALALKAPGVRIIAPIPGRGTVGIEIPNHKPAVVRFSSIIRSPKYHNPDIKLPIAMGKTVVGEVYCADLAKMPHLLIAGATGKGKSVGINTIIASLLYRMHPRDLKFVIVDPKRVEMTLYKALKDHFLAVSPDINETIITEPQNAVAVLKSVVEEMQQRYSVLAAAGQRNIADYNTKARDGSLKDKGGMQHRPMPYIVVIIDELADLMMTASKEVEEPIVRLAQLARAVGIHCVVATQRPSVDVVTGLIKANFPARIAYQVASRIDSRTILDASGAEHLIGNGDMLFNPGNMTKPMRMQNAFISTDEVEAICEHIGNQRGYSTPYILPSINTKKGGGGSGGSDDRDVLFEDAARIFIQLQQASVSTLQRRLKVGYARAARIVDELEMAGIVGPPDGSKGRQVLLMSESELEAYL